MLKRHVVLGALTVALLGIYSVGDAKETKKQEIKLDGIKCLFCKMDVDKDVFVEYKGARVFFGCAGCPEEFKKNFSVTPFVFLKVIISLRHSSTLSRQDTVPE